LNARARSGTGKIDMVRSATMRGTAAGQIGLHLGAGRCLTLPPGGIDRRAQKTYFVNPTKAISAARYTCPNFLLSFFRKMMFPYVIPPRQRDVSADRHDT
jgi:hypothetical protein